MLRVAGGIATISTEVPNAFTAGKDSAVITMLVAETGFFMEEISCIKGKKVCNKNIRTGGV